MKQFTLKSLEFHNFKGFKDKTIDFGNVTSVNACNGEGKTTIATGWIWLFSNYGYYMENNPKVRREVNNKPVNDVDVSVKAVLEYNGKVVTVEKIQHRTVKKDGSYADTNKYLVNSAPMTQKSFNEYFDLDSDTFLICSNVNAFISKNQKDMRKFLFSLVTDVTDLDIANCSDDLKELVPLLADYTKDELLAMKKSELSKISKQIDSIKPRIDEVNRSIVEVDVDSLNSQKAEIQKQIAELQKQEDDSTEMFKKYQEEQDKVFKIKMDMNSIEQKANDNLLSKKREIQSRIDSANDEFQSAFRDKKLLQASIEDLEKEISLKKLEKDSLVEKYKVTYSMKIDENATVCPTCGRKYDDDELTKILTDFDVRKNQTLSLINKDGNELKEEIESKEKQLEELKMQIDGIKKRMITANGNKSLAMQEMDNLPSRVDLYSNEDYCALEKLLNSTEKSLKDITTGADYRSQLRIKRLGLQEEEKAIDMQLMKVNDNLKSKERIEELRKESIANEQKKADCEKIIYLIKELDKKKSEQFTDKINSFFSVVKWDLFSYKKNGEPKDDYCVPTVDGYKYGDTANEGRDIAAKLDIVNSIQKIKGIKLPVFLDRAESINDWNIPQIDSQLVLLRVTNDRDMKVEVVE